LVQNLADLGLEIPGQCFAIAVAVGSLCGAAREPASQPAMASRALPRSALAVLLVGAVLVTGSAFAGMHDVAADRLSLRRQLLAPPRPRPKQRCASLRAELRAAMLRHPAEPYFPLLGAVLAWEQGDENPVPWLQRTLERSLSNGKAHLLLARVLRDHGAASQSLLELRLAVEADPSLVGRAARLATRWSDELEALSAAVPRGRLEAESWEALGAHARQRTLGALCDQRALDADPGLVAPRVRLAGDRIEAREAKRACITPEQEQRCGAEVAGHAAAIASKRPGNSEAARLRARWLAATGEVAAGERMLAELCGGVSDQVTCLYARAELAARLTGAEPFNSAVKTLQRAACGARDDCARVNTWIADAQMRRKEYGAAVSAYKRAIRDCETDERLLILASAASLAGLHSQALRALERLLKRRGSDDPALKARVMKERERVMKLIMSH